MTRAATPLTKKHEIEVDIQVPVTDLALPQHLIAELEIMIAMPVRRHAITTSVNPMLIIRTKVPGPEATQVLSTEVERRRFPHGVLPRVMCTVLVGPDGSV